MFSADAGTAALIRQVLDDLKVEEESCSEAVAAAQLVTQQAFQFVIIDWDQQPEASLLLTAARERKASERPLTLAIVSDDASVPKALQAGANSILRKPILLNQVKDTLKTARDLLRARQESASAAAAGASASSAASLPSSMVEGNEKTLRAGEFLHSSASTQATQFDTESDMQKSLEQSAIAELDPLKELEPMAAAVTPAKAELSSAPAPTSNEPRGLQWFLNRRAATLPPVPAPSPATATQGNPELLGFDQMASQPAAAQSAEAKIQEEPAPESAPETAPAHTSASEQKDEAALFAYIAGEGEKPGQSEQKTRPPFRLGRGPIIGAALLAACAVAAAPQAPWHAAMRSLWGREQQALHAWLNPQPVTPAQAPESHESFGRAGDEYKLPVAENIPDATTDPSQIRVTPMVDPTAKKNNAAANVDQTAAPVDAANTSPDQPSQATGQVQEASAGSATPAGVSSTENPSPNLEPTSATTVASPPPVAISQPHTDLPTPNLPVIAAPQPLPQRTPQIHQVSTAAANPPIPSSLKSQMASMTPDASGNKPVEAAMPSIEPVNVPEAAERALLTDQPALAYPASAKGQQGTVILQVLIGRDGTVQDAKFIQGSLAFARAAIDGAKQWKFKPYTLNGRAVSVQTSLTIGFKPAP